MHLNRCYRHTRSPCTYQSLLPIWSTTWISGRVLSLPSLYPWSSSSRAYQYTAYHILVSALLRCNYKSPSVSTELILHLTFAFWAACNLHSSRSAYHYDIFSAPDESLNSSVLSSFSSIYLLKTYHKDPLTDVKLRLIVGPKKSRSG